MLTKSGNCSLTTKAYGLSVSTIKEVQSTHFLLMMWEFLLDEYNELPMPLLLMQFYEFTPVSLHQLLLPPVVGWSQWTFKGNKRHTEMEIDPKKQSHVLMNVP